MGAAPQPSPSDSASAAGEASGAQTGALGAFSTAAFNSLALGLGDYIGAGARYIGQRATGVAHPDDFQTDLSYVRGRMAGARAAHPYVALAGDVAGAAAPGAALGRAVANGSGLAARLALQENQPVRNIMRLVGSGAMAGGAYGEVTGGIEGAKQGGVPGAISGAAQGAGVGSIAGAGGGIVGAGLGYGAGALAAKAAPVAQRSVRALADKLGVSPDHLATLMEDFRSRTGHAPRIADIVDAVTKANLEPSVNAYQSSAAAMQSEAEAARAALPARLSHGVESGGVTPTPFGPSMSAARIADLIDEQTKQMNVAMGDRSNPLSLANQPVTISKSDAVVLSNPLVRRALSQDDMLRGKLAEAIGNATTNGADRSLTVDDFDRLRIALRGQQQATVNPNSRYHAPQLAQDYAKIANAVTDFVGNQHNDYGKAIDAFHRQSDFIAGFRHAASGKSIYDAQDAGEIGRLDTPEGRGGLELGARSLLYRDAAETENGALRTADLLRQGAPSKTLESLPAAERDALKARGAAESTSQRNFSDLSVSGLPSKDAEAAQALQRAAEGVVSVGGHALTGFKTHVWARLLARLGVSEPVSNALVAQIVRARSPQDVAQLKTALNRYVRDARARRLILKNIGRGAGAGAAAAYSSLNQRQQ